ncbi:MAG: trypsin-like peptidase domain-containing protein [Alphaproteobacteria bacterium]|nr:trypsin-like peptidase domain-containing protein [Alphaproteobacteria bacterium]
MRYISIFFAGIMLVAAIVVFPAGAEEAPATDEAQRLYQAYGDAVYQVQVIDLTSGKKASIGSGFQFTEDGLIATNYHVVAKAIQRAESNRIKFLHDKGGEGSLKVLTVDVVRDLAIVKMDHPGKTWLSLGTSKQAKGAKMYALGNPNDIGFTIIEGTYSGLSKESFIDKIHFSGALNPGMSGGPAIDHNGGVVGINVETSGNQIGFLVPVEPLRQLLDGYLRLPTGYDFINHADDHIQDQLFASQERNISTLLKKKWESVPFGPVMVPGRIHEVLKCWGGINHKEKDPYQYFLSTCSSQDRMFLDNDFGTGVLLYRYDYMVGKDTFNPVRFYSFYQGLFGYSLGNFQNAKEGDVTNFDCNSRFVDIAGFRWKSSFCVRQYKKYPKIFDMNLHMAMVGVVKKGFIVTMTAQGVSKQNSLALVQKFISEIRPRPADNIVEEGATP